MANPDPNTAREEAAKLLLELRFELQSFGILDAEDLAAASPEQLPDSGMLSSLTTQLRDLSAVRRGYFDSLKETERGPLSHEPQRLSYDQILVVSKFSKVEFDLRQRKVSMETLLEQYQQEGVDIERIVSSHEIQLEALEQLKRIIPGAKFIDRDEAEHNPQMVKESALVVALGGDDNLKFISRMVEDGFLLGINSDPAFSQGALTYDTVKTFAETVERLRSGEFRIQEWPRLEVSVNGSTLPPACSEIYIGDRENIYTARARATLGELEFPIKGSGMIIANGAGSTGWFRAASLYLSFGEHIWRRTLPHAEFVSREPYGSAESLKDKRLNGTLKPGEVLEITSSSNHHPIVSVDSVVSAPFPRGMTAKVRFSDLPLKVVVGSKD